MADPFAASLLPAASAFEALRLPDAQLLYHENFLPAAEASRLLEVLTQETPWRQDSIRIHGKLRPIPRLQAWYGTPGADYAYSGLKLQALPFTATLLELRRTLEAALGVTFNSVLLNFYRDGQDSMGWHSDDEPELGKDPGIASLSLGATRRFEMKHRSQRLPGKQHIALRHGSLLYMGKGVQQHWLHRIPKQPGITSSRLNLTFRLLV